MAMAAEGTVGARERMAALLEQGQSVWLDYITRDLVRKGELQRDDRGVRPAGDDLEPDDLPEGDRRGPRLR